MGNFYLFLLSITLTFNLVSSNNEILPFSSIQMQGDNIFVSIDLNRHEFSKLLSINNIGSDALVNFSKQHYGLMKCDLEFECYKYNLIKNFNEVFQLFTQKSIGNNVSLELEMKNNHRQNGIDVISNNTKFQINQKFFEQNVKESKKYKYDSFGEVVAKGLNKLKRTFSDLFKDDNKTKTNSAHSNSNLRKELSEMKKNIEKLQKEEIKIETNLIKDFNNITKTLESEKTLVNGLYKREIIAGIIGGVSVGLCVILFYFFNGLIKAKLTPY